MRSRLPWYLLVVALFAPAWRSLADDTLLDAARAGEALVAVGVDGRILRTDTAGAWTTVVPPNAEAPLCGVAFADGDHGWAVGHHGVILATSDQGREWTTVRAPQSRHPSLLDVWAVSRDQVFAVGASGTYLQSRDGGRTWHRRSLDDVRAHLNRINAAPDGTLFIAGDEGTLLRSSDRGAKWERLPIDETGPLYGVLPLSSGTLLAYGAGGRVHRSTDGGRRWQRIDTGMPGVLFDGAQLEDGSIVLAGQAGLGLSSRDDGRSFRVAAHERPVVARLLVHEGRRVWALGEGGVGVLDIPE